MKLWLQMRAGGGGAGAARARRPAAATKATVDVDVHQPRVIGHCHMSLHLELGAISGALLL